MPLIRTTSAVGIVLFFVGAVITHLRVRDNFVAAAFFLLLAVAELVLGLYAR
ncbi:MAG: DoxX family protein [Candidatus Sulfotelmatobacter sp.]